MKAYIRRKSNKMFQRVTFNEGGVRIGHCDLDAKGSSFYMIYNVFVLEKFRGKGLASKMMTELVRRLENYNLLLHVASENIPAVNAYKRAGFNFIGETKNNYYILIKYSN